jgi:hypothetical protein
MSYLGIYKENMQISKKTDGNQIQNWAKKFISLPKVYANDK